MNKKSKKLSVPGVRKVVPVMKSVATTVNNVGFDSSFSSESFAKCGFIHHSFSFFYYMETASFPAVTWYIWNVTRRLESEKERNPKLDFFPLLENKRSSHIFESNIYSSYCHWPKYYV